MQTLSFPFRLAVLYLGTTEDGDLSKRGHNGEQSVGDIGRSLFNHLFCRTRPIEECIRLRDAQTEQLSFKTRIIEVLIVQRGNGVQTSRLYDELGKVFHQRSIEFGHKIEMNASVQLFGTILCNAR